MIYAIGDIHGTYVKLIRLYQKIMLHMKYNGVKRATIIFLGDYVDRGPHPHKVFDFLMNLKDTDEIKHIFLKGNHEDMMIHAYDGADYKVWVANGGRDTLNAFDIGCPEDFVGNEEVKPYIDWCRQLDVMHVVGKYIFVHGGYDPKRPPNDQKDEVLMWKRSTPYMDGREYETCDYTIVHGHTPHKEPKMYKNEINVDTFAYYDGPLTAVAIPEDITQYNADDIYGMTDDCFNKVTNNTIEFLTAQ
jgi:serine/threonine protein phosphatase 1